MTQPKPELSDGYLSVSSETIRDILIHVITRLSPLHIPLIVGPPGVGKSEMIRETLSFLKKDGVFPPPLSMQESCDLRGLPYHNHATKRTEWYVPNWLPADPDWDGVIFLDEAPQGDYDTLKPLGQLLMERSIGEYKLPSMARWILAGNRRGDGAGVGKLPTPLINRVSIIGMEPDVDAWLRWGDRSTDTLYSNSSSTTHQNGLSKQAVTTSEGRINNVVRSYFGKLRRDHFNTFDPTRQAPFASARSITRVSEFLDSSPPLNIILPYVCGLIGTAVGTEFCGYLDMYTTAPDMDVVAVSPDNVAAPDKNPALMCAVCSAATAYCSKRLPPVLQSKDKFAESNFIQDINKVGKIITWVSRMPDEYAVFFIKETALARPGVLECSEYRNTMLPKLKAKLLNKSN